MRSTVFGFPGRWMACFSLLVGGDLGTIEAGEQAPSRQLFPMVTNVLQLHQLVGHERRVVCEFRLEGVVCAANAEKGLLVLRDDSGAELLRLDLEGQAVRPGQRVRLESGPCTATLDAIGLGIGTGPVVDNDGTHPMRERFGMAYLRAAWHPIRVTWFKGTGSRGLEIGYEGPGLPRQNIPDSALFRPVVAPGGGSSNWVHGLDYRAYEGSWISLPDFSQLTAVRTGAAASFDLAAGARKENVGIEFTGYLAVPQEGLYTFFAKSEDGSQLFVGASGPRPEVFGLATVPVPRRVAIGEVLREQEKDEWAEVEGTVSFVSQQGGSLELELRAGTERMRVLVADGSGSSPALLLHTRVRAVGVCRSLLSFEGRRVAGELSVLSGKQIAPIEAPPGLWSAYPLMAVSNVARADFPARMEEVVHVCGRVESFEPGKLLVVEDGTGRVLVETTQATPEPKGGRVEVLGRRSVVGTNMALRCGLYREVMGGASEGTGALPVLTTVEEVRRLRREEAQRGYPVRLRGVVTRARPWNAAVVIQDATQGIYVGGIRVWGYEAPRVGEYLEVEGVAAPGDFAPDVTAQRVSRLGMGCLPEPVPATWDQLMQGSLDMQYVEIQGIVTAVEGTRLELLLRGGKINLDLPDLNPETLLRYDNTLIRLRGCLSPNWDRATHQLSVGVVAAYNTSISVEEPAEGDVFSTSRKRAAELLLFDPRAGAFQRVKVGGQILGVRGGQYFVGDGTNGLRLIAKRAAGLKAGDLVEAVGFAELSGPSPVVREAVVRKTGHGDLPAVRKLEPEDLIDGAHDALRVQVEGVLVNLRRERTEQVLEMQVGLRSFAARIEGRDESVRLLVPGSRLELTGVYMGLGGNRALRRNIDSFELLLASPSDIRVLARPPWLTLAKVLGAFGVAVVVLLGAMLWALSLRQQVLAQTRIIRLKAQREASLEERTRIARNIHDDLGSDLTRITMLGERARECLVPSGEAGMLVRRIVATARTTVQSLDETVWAVDPKKDTLEGLVSYLNQYADQFFEGTSTRCWTETPSRLSPLVVPAEVRHDLFLVVKEALNNVLKHAQATEVRLRLAEAAGAVTIEIQDNGCGFDTREANASAKGNGLENLSKRVERLGGGFCLTSTPGQGTRLQFSIQVGSREEAR